MPLRSAQTSEHEVGEGKDRARVLTVGLPPMLLSVMHHLFWAPINAASPWDKQAPGRSILPQALFSQDFSCQCDYLLALIV